MKQKFIQIWKARDLRNSLLYILGLLVIFRLAAHIPILGVDASALKDLFNNNQVLGMLNMFSGGSMENFSVVMMGVGALADWIGILYTLIIACSFKLITVFLYNSVFKTRELVKSK